MEIISNVMHLWCISYIKNSLTEAWKSSEMGLQKLCVMIIWNKNFSIKVVFLLHNFTGSVYMLLSVWDFFINVKKMSMFWGFYLRASPRNGIPIGNLSYLLHRAWTPARTWWGTWWGRSYLREPGRAYTQTFAPARFPIFQLRALFLFQTEF